VVGRLEVGLVETGEHPLRVGRLELRVEVDALVDGVDEPVQALAGVHELAARADGQRVVLGQRGQLDAVLLAVAGHVQPLPVQLGGLDGLRDEVDPGRRAGLAARERDRGEGGEGALPGLAVPVREVKLDVIGLHIEQRRAPLCLLAGQVGRGHWSPRVACGKAVVHQIASNHPSRECRPPDG
jgi:hypothetical protein